jgi:2-polyprenyl-3-methyl-5-hydroxy-6-metoxy-1,4-benzoquinol methylase
VNIPPEYTQLPNGTLKRNDGATTDYTQPYWGVEGKSSIEEQVFNVGVFLGDNGKTKAETAMSYAVGEQLLEIGCAPGEILRQAVAKGFAVVVGLEPCPEHIEFIESHSNAAVICRSFEDFDTDLTYDTIIALDVLEHVPDPEAFVDKAFSLLNSKGRLILMTPVLGPDIPWRDCDFHPEHLHLFHIDHIKEWLNPIALELWHPGHMTIVCEKP